MLFRSGYGWLLDLPDQRDILYSNVSRLFIYYYYNERVIEHTTKSDSGAMIRDGIKTVVKQGLCSERKWPYVISKFSVKPPAACYSEALQHQVTSYQRILTGDEMRTCLGSGFSLRVRLHCVRELRVAAGGSDGRGALAPAR